ncbi:MAG: type III pantothenate kinase [Rhodanobacteraceae bacterium]
MSAPATTWVFDLGNSRLKAACLDGGDLAQPVALTWETAGFDGALSAHLQRWPSAYRVLIASVAPASHADRLLAALRAWPRAHQQWLRSPRQGCGITNTYRVPERLGIDRFLAMASARAAADDAPVIVIGCGTALTLDAVDASGMQQGGLIAPSPGLMLRALRGATAIDRTNPEAFAPDETDDSARALRQGCARAAASLVAWYDARQRAVGGDPVLWLHGGGAAVLRESLEGETARRARLLEDAVLRGLALWATHENAGTGPQSAAPPE